MTDTPPEEPTREQRDRAFAGLVRKHENLSPNDEDPPGLAEEAHELAGFTPITLPQMIDITRRAGGTPEEIERNVTYLIETFGSPEGAALLARGGVEE